MDVLVRWWGKLSGHIAVIYLPSELREAERSIPLKQAGEKFGRRKLAALRLDGRSVFPRML